MIDICPNWVMKRKRLCKRNILLSGLRSIFAIFGAVFLSLSSHQLCFAAPPANAEWKLSFSDEFDGNTLDTKVWEVESGAPGHILSSRWPENIVINKGVCRIITKSENRGGRDWTTGHMWTRFFRQSHGYFEARLKISAAGGLNNAFWLMTRPEKTFEIDIVEAQWPSKILTNAHTWFGSHKMYSKIITTSYDLSKDFHVYGMEWDSNSIRWFLDGSVIREKLGIELDAPVPVIFSTAVKRLTPELNGSFMEIDYVRVYVKRDGREE